MKPCATCGTVLAPIRDDGNCFRCHINGITFLWHGGAKHGHANWHTSKWDWLKENIGDMSKVTKSGGG